MNIDSIAFNAIKKYKNTLSKVGYCNSIELKKALVLIFITELLKDDYSVFITEDDYSIINNTLMCLSKNSCLIDYYEYAHHVEPIKNYLLDTPIKISEKNVIRFAENNVLKLINKNERIYK